MQATSARELGVEALGTCVMVALGTGAVATATLFGWPGEPWQMALVWAAAVWLGIAVAARGSATHLNPAVSVALAAVGVSGMRWRRVAAYAAAQLAGATLAGALVLLVFGTEIERFEAREGLVRGTPGAGRAAAMFGESFPDPGRRGAEPVPVGSALLWEAGGTAALLFVVTGLAFARGAAARWARGPRAARTLVALTVAAAILVVAPATQCGINPARDLGPRLVAWAGGFGPAAFPGSAGGWWVYVVGPLVGGLLGAGAARALARASSPTTRKEAA